MTDVANAAPERKQIRQVSRSDSVDIVAKRRQVVDDEAATRLPPSTLSRNFSTLSPSKFALHRPPTPNIIPLALLHPIFAEFVANVKERKPTLEDHALARDLCDSMSQEWDLETDQCERFRQILANHYHIQLYAAEVAGTTRKTDGHVMVGSFMSTVFEGKTWSGCGSPEVQGSLHWLESVRKTVQGGDPLDLMPCIVIHLVGTCLFPALYPCLLLIGSLIGFSGVVLTDRVQLQSLTEVFPLHENLHEGDIVIRVARAFGAYRIAVDTLREHYQNLPKLPTRESVHRVTFPYPDSWATDGGVKFTYRSRFDKDRLIFLATTIEGATVLVKFTRRYSAAAHQLCADAGVAPQLIGFRYLPGGWYMAVMEYLDPLIYRVLEPRDYRYTELVAGVQKVIETLHAGGFVHGDIRYVNMMTRHEWKGSEAMGNVFLIDFDWAGHDGNVRYPPHLNNKSVKRHDEAKGEELVSKAHDWFMVEHMFIQ
jgi:hypothetical protein